MISRRNVLLALPSLFVMKAFAKKPNSQIIRVVYHPDIAPYSFQYTDQHSPQGILVDLINALSPALNLTTDHTSYPWKRAQLMVASGKLDAFCCPMNATRERYAVFAPTPIIRLQKQVVFFNPNGPNANAIKNAQRIEDFHSFKTATFFGNTSHELIWKAHPGVIKVARIEQILMLLARGRIDFYFADPLVTNYKIKKLKLENKLASAALGNIIHQDNVTEMCFGLRRSYPNADQLIKKIDASIQQVITPSLRQEVISRYM